jgi:hypothetical protein
MSSRITFINEIFDAKMRYVPLAGKNNQYEPLDTRIL